MCGIAGWYRRDGVPVDRAVLRAQCDALIHRGPDDEGMLIDGDFGFGMRRLSILDLAGGHQPMTDRGTGVSLVSNGEIVNFRELRAELEGLGARFSTTSDTEVVLRGLVTWGDDVWERLEGMFAIAAWDPRDRLLRLVRDPLGIKPLYYAVDGPRVAFASELKGLHPVPGLAFEPSAASIDAFFAFGHVLAPDTIYADVHKLPPASLLTLTRDGRADIRQYWRPGFRHDVSKSETEWIEEFRETFTATVARHMISDVPLGAFLSGGVDSSAVVAAMQRSSAQPVRTFTIGFDDRRLDESSYAARIAAHLGCEHTHRLVQLEDASRILPEIACCYDEPFADSSAIPTWYLARVAREHVTVALSGDGGDEIFAGYGRHRSERLLERYDRPVLRRASAAVAYVPRLPSPRWNAFRERVEKIRADSLLPSTYQRFLSKDMLIPADSRSALYTAEFRARLDGVNSLEALEARFLASPVSGDAVENMLYADTVVRLPNDMLTKVDRASMAHSLEVRVPFLSHRLVDWAAAVPVDLKLNGSTGKWIVRKAIEPWLPTGILDRPKQGFSIPLASWVRGDFGAYVEQVWRDSGAHGAGVLDRGAVAQLFDEHRRGVGDRSRTLYALAMFSLWWSQRPRPAAA